MSQPVALVRWCDPSGLNAIWGTRSEVPTMTPTTTSRALRTNDDWWRIRDVPATEIHTFMTKSPTFSHDLNLVAEAHDLVADR
jgi:hypothetical protein